MEINKRTKTTILGLIFTLLVLVFGEKSVTNFITNVYNPEILGTTEIKSGLVTRVIDGDTLELDAKYSVRLIGIDAPEEKGDECFNLESTLALEEMTLNRTITLEKDISDTDKYDRLLRYIWIDDVMINQKLVEQGYSIAKSYPPDTKYVQDLVEAQSYAKSNNHGLWGKCL